MKTFTLPSLRIDPAFRRAAESVLQDGETLHGFVETSLRAQIALRRSQDASARCLTSADDARRSGIYVAASDVVKKLEESLDEARKRRQ